MKLIVLMQNDTPIGIYTTQTALVQARLQAKQKLEAGMVSQTVHFHTHEFILNDPPK